MKINVALVLRLEDKVVKEFDNVTEAIEEIEDIEYKLNENENQWFDEKYIVNVKIELFDSEYILHGYDYGNLYKFEEFENSYIDTLEEMYNNLDYRENIPFLNEIFENDWDILESYFDSKEAAAKAVYFGDYNFNDDYVYFNGYANLVSLDYIPYEDYETEIFNQWLDENL